METGPRLSSHVERTVTGPMWHGPALSEVLEGVSAKDAAARPITGAHTIWELVLHITAWAEIARDRLQGNRTSGITDAENFPTPPAPTEANWSAAVAAMHAAYSALARDAGGLSEAQLKAKVPEGVQQKDRQQDGPRLELVKPRDEIEPGGDPEHQRAEQQIDRQDVHAFCPTASSVLEFPYLNRRSAGSAGRVLGPAISGAKSSR